MKKQIRTMKREYPLPQKWLKKALFIVLLFSCKLIFAQVQPEHKVQVSPNGVMDDMYDLYGNKYTLKDLIIENANVKSFVTSINCGCFTAYFEAGCGMGETNLIETPRRDVLCKLLTDLSDFITPTNPSVKVNIWVRNLANLPNIGNPATSNVLGMATSFYNIPSGTSASIGGIADNTIWKTIISGADSYTNTASPIMPTSGGIGFYHALMAFNFSNTTNISWNTNLGITNMPGQYDLYTIMLHEMTHALGFSSLIDLGGSSVVGVGKNYKSRYDLLLKSSNNINILATPSIASPMYNNLINSNLNSIIFGTDPLGGGCITDVTSCNNAIKYIGSTTQKVYNPNCYEKGISLSHFEDQCLVPDQNNQYFVMANKTGTNIAKRFLKPEERQVLCDLGYKVQSIYGSGATLHNYNTTMCNSGMVAGINDGLNGATYSYIFDGTNSLNILPLANDYSQNVNNLKIEGVEQILGTHDILSNTLNSITFKPSSTSIGLNVLRYVPYDYITGIRGNITYIYIFNPSAGCEPNTCNMVSNGNLELSQGECYAGMGDLYNTVNCWFPYISNPDLFTRNLDTACIYNIPTEFSNPKGETWDNEPPFSGGNNNHFIGLFGRTVNGIIQEGIETQLSSPFTDGNIYTIGFWAKVANSYDFDSQNGNIDICGSQNILAPTAFYNPASSDIKVFGTVEVPANGRWNYLTYTFQYNGNPLNALLLVFAAYRQPTTTKRFIYIDDVSARPADLSVTFNPPSSICQNSQPLNLTSYVQPPGGSFSGLGVTGNMFNPNTSGIGSSSTILYTYTNPTSGCPVTVPATISINPAPIASISGEATSCGSLVYSVTQAPSTTYTWSANNGAIMSPATGPSSTLSNITNNTTITLVATNQYGCSSSTTKEVIYCCPPPRGVQMFTNPNTAVISNYLQTNSTVCISGTWTIDASATYTLKTFLMEPNAKIIINDGQTLTLTEGCQVKSNCNYMWDGITVPSTGALEVLTSTIEDAKIIATCSSGRVKGSGATFTNNYQGIVINSNGLNPNLSTFTASTFATTRALLPPFNTAQCGYSGIELNNVKFITIGNSSATSSLNTFNNLSYGIKASESSATIVNNKFINIMPTDVSMGRAILFWGGAAISRNLTVGGINASLFEKNYFVNCRAGIETVRKGLYNIKGNEFTGIDRYPIYCHDHWKATINIESNLFVNNIQNSIYTNATTGTTLNIKSNKINTSAASTVDCYEGIKVSSNLFNSSNTTNIQFNDIKRCKTAIFALLSANCNIMNNAVYTPIRANSSDPKSYGIRIEGSTTDALTHNITGNLLTYDGVINANSMNDVIGIYVYANHINVLTSNIATKYGSGIMCNEGNGNTRMNCNQMDGCYKGIQLNNANIGNQGTSVLASDNLWYNMTTNRVAGNLGNYPTYWYFKNLATTVLTTANSTVTGAPFYRQVVNNTNSPCGSGGMSMMAGKGVDSERDMVLSSAINTTTASDAMLTIASQDVSSYNMESFAYSTIKNKNWTNIAGSANNAKYQNYFNTLKTKKAGIVVDATELMAAGNFNAAQQKLNSLSTDSDWSSNLKFALQKQLDRSRNFEQAFTSADIDLLKTIAYQHPKDGGEAVFIARSLLNITVDDNWDAPLKTQNAIGTIKPIESGETVKVYPNPAGNHLSIELISNALNAEEGETNGIENNFVLYNMMGTVVYSSTLKSNLNTIDISFISNGIYFYSIKDINGDLISVDKLIINH
ncbi:MAG: T9SS type A sorting domain-containing protein [Bacteroidota bacterium]